MGAYYAAIVGSTTLVYGLTHNDFTLTAVGLTFYLLIIIQTLIWRNK